METHGFLAPETETEARERYEAVGPAAQTVVKETAKAMQFAPDEYDERVTGEVVETARDALFASLLTVRTGTREEYDDWLADRDREVVEEGSENVERVAWHDALGETVVAATYQREERAAVATLRRQAFGRVYREML
ncbi:DUF5809 family protein [Halorussus gelatinilyticus]|uniref:DUF5809 family protein n=1 Tax=Halorussus gelatinilyticus TaxID=2937524 RepID=A0A8U0INK0_9EURY|nr:DUF5809 family protein [Halorussus gelatinilyticus]UPW02205.1 DUF5809 family protein [Halorussus gelatinilyticus]